MLNPQTIIRINKKMQNPLVLQAFFYDLDNQSGFMFNKQLNQFECNCKFCLGFTTTLEADHFVNLNAQKTPRP